ncbi:MAG: zf-HC2 domain-containing protein [Planctomycetota bacterium]
MDDCSLAGALTAYVQNELAAAERAEFERHLASCAECRDGVAAVRALIERLRSVPEGPETDLPDLVEGVLSRIPEGAWEPSGRGRNGSAFKWASRALQAAAVLVVGMALGLVALRGPDADRAPPAEGQGNADAQSPAVLRALAWLASTQGPDGAWDAEAWGGQEHYTPALTGLATLALISDTPAAGAPHDVAPHEAARADAVRKAAAYLAGAVGRSGRIGPRFDAALYNHGIATVALLEAYALTRDESLKGPITRALAYIRAEQTPSGGWGYAGGRQVNTAISVWQVNALLLAGALGWPEAEAAAVAGKGLAWLEDMIDGDGRAGYDARGRFPNGPEGLTAMAALSLGAAGEAVAPAGDARSRATRSLVKAASYRPRDLDYYRAFFLEYALRAVEQSASGAEGQAPSGVRPALTGVAGGRSREMIVGSQVKTGPNSGSFEPRDRWSSAGGRVYSTAMAALSLQAEENAPRLIAMMRGGPR